MTKPIEPFPGNVRVTVPAHLLDPRGGEHYVLRVIGDGMLAECVCDGDFIVVRRSAAPQPGEMVVALVGDEATLKRYYPEGPMVRLVPGNPALPPLLVPAAEVKVQGVVVGLMRKFA